MKLIYCAGPYRAKNSWEIEQNIVRARQWGALVAAAGAYPVIPHSNTSHFDGIVDDNFWIYGTLELMCRCDAVIMMDNWIMSAGSRGEKLTADQLGIPVLDVSGMSNLSNPEKISEIREWIDKLPAARQTSNAAATVADNQKAV